MKLSDLTQRAGEWLRGIGPRSEIVISSRVRLARNVAGFPFLSRCSPRERQALHSRIRDAILNSGAAEQLLYVDLEQAPDLDRELLVERHLISRPPCRRRGCARSRDRC